MNLLKADSKLGRMKENMRNISQKFENYNVIKMYMEGEKCY